MATEARETAGLIGSDKVEGTYVYDAKGEHIGSIERVMIEKVSGQVAYAVLQFGGFLGIGSKLFAVPFEALELDAENQRFVLGTPREKLEQAPGFDKDQWPDFADPSFGREVYGYYGVSTYW